MRCRLSEVDATQLLPNAKPANVSGISIIIPAHNAEATLEVTLNSVLSQTHTAWEAVIIDHGSTDATHAMAEGWALRDRRFRVLHQEKSGVSTARNGGLQEARYPFVLFLDSDDRIAPTHLERMAGMLLANSRLDAVHCGWQRILPSGALGPPHLGSDEEDLFEYFAFQCIFAVHACILRRELALAVGFRARAGGFGLLPSPREFRQSGQSALPDRRRSGPGPRPWTGSADANCRSSPCRRTGPCLP
jgi:hypothetical protein